MFREMRRKNQLLGKEAVECILKDGTSGILAVQGDDDYPYAVPLSYVYENEVIYFHTAKTGHKVDAIKKNDKVSFTVIGRDDVVLSAFTTHFSSVVAFGKARVIEDLEEKLRTIRLLTRKYSPGFEEAMENEIKSGLKHMLMVAVDIEYMTGKASLQLIKNKELG